MFRNPFNRILRSEAGPAGDGGGGANPAPAPSSTAPAPDNVSPFSPDGKLGDGWWNKLGEEFTPHAERAATFKDVGGLFKSYVHALGMKPSFPKEGASEADIAAWRELAGVPAEVAGYGLKPPENLPDGVQVDQAMLDRVAAIGHKHHVPAAALQALIAEQIAISGERAVAARDAAAASKKASEDALISEWKGNFEANKNTVRHLIGKLAESAAIPDGPELQALADNPTFAKMVLQMSRRISEDGVRAPAGFGDLRGPQQRADAIMSGKDPEWGERYRRGDIQAMELVCKLLQEAQS